MAYTPVYPIHDEFHVKATSIYNISYLAMYATDPARYLTGSWESNSWLATNTYVTNQRFHFDLGIAKIVRRINYENSHHYGTLTNSGVQNFTFWGSNDAAAFGTLTYSTDTNWTQLTIAQSTFDQHAASDTVDPKYILVTNSIAYRYYAFKFADNYGNGTYLNVRRVSLMTEDGYDPSRVVGNPVVDISGYGRL